jgi:hypothetical protein
MMLVLSLMTLSTSTSTSTTGITHGATTPRAVDAPAADGAQLSYLEAADSGRDSGRSNDDERAASEMRT